MPGLRPCRGAMWSTVILSLTLGDGGAARAQTGGYAPADIEYGRLVYETECTSCHGDTGTGVPTVDLGRGRFRNATTDRDLRRLLRSGIEDTAMPPFDLDRAETAGIVAYLRNMEFETDEVTLGDPVKGRALFEGRGECASCHRVNGRGSRLAPELSTIGARRPPSALRQALLDPTGAMWPINRPVVIVTRSGERVTGRRLNEDTYTVQLIDEQARLRSFDKADLREFTVLTESPMPSYEDRLDAEELADVLAYLVSLKE